MFHILSSSIFKIFHNNQSIQISEEFEKNFFWKILVPKKVTEICQKKFWKLSKILNHFAKYEGYFKSFASLIHSPQKIKKWTSNQKNFILPVITFFLTWSSYLTKHFPYWSMNLLIAAAYHTGFFFSIVFHFEVRHSYLFVPHLNLCTHRFTVDFVITFCTLYTTHILTWISQPKTFSSVKNQITLRY